MEAVLLGRWNYPTPDNNLAAKKKMTKKIEQFFHKISVTLINKDVDGISDVPKSPPILSNAHFERSVSFSERVCFFR